MTDYLASIPYELKEAIRTQKLITFVGAGLSYEIKNRQGQKIKGWKNMVVQLLEHLNKSVELNHLIPLLDKYDPIDVLHLIEKDNSISKQKIYDFMKDFFDLDEEGNDYSLHKDISRLTNKIITTNYDGAFEIASPILRKFKAYKGKNYELTKHKDAEAKLLFKLHGCYEDSDSMVIFPTNYDALYNNPTNKDAEHSLLVLNSIIAQYSLLIVGAGMGDHQINTLFRELKNIEGGYSQRHYIITTTPLDSSLDFLTPITVKDRKEIPALIQALLSLKEEIDDTNDQKVKELETQLADANEKIKALEAEKNLSEEKELEKKALKYFSKGVEYSLTGEHEKAAEKYEVVTDFKKDFHDAYYNWGTGLGILAQDKEGIEKESLYTQAFEKYELAIQYKEDKHEAYNNWGNDLAKLAQDKEGIEKESLYIQAFEKFQFATQCKKDFHQAYHNWGTELGSLAQEKEGIEKESLYTQAFEKYQLATQYKKDDYEAYYNWGTELGILAEEKEGIEKESLYTQAFEKFQFATQYKEDFHDAYNNWGTGLARLTQEKEGKEKEKLLTQAFEIWKKGVAVGGNAYHLAYLYILTQQKEHALHYLALSLERKEVSTVFVLEDGKWKDYKQDSSFLKIIAKYATS